MVTRKFAVRPSDEATPNCTSIVTSVKIRVPKPTTVVALVMVRGSADSASISRMASSFGRPCSSDA
jgi:hypothetical protein